MACWGMLSLWWPCWITLIALTSWARCLPTLSRYVDFVNMYQWSKMLSISDIQNTTNLSTHIYIHIHVYIKYFQPNPQLRVFQSQGRAPYYWRLPERHKMCPRKHSNIKVQSYMFDVFGGKEKMLNATENMTFWLIFRWPVKPCWESLTCLLTSETLQVKK